jgi:uncharacterized protein DUF4886
MSKQMLCGALSAALAVFVAATFVTATPAAAQVETIKPKVLESGVENPRSAIYIGNSFFYYNNSLHNHVSLLILAADPNYRFRSTSVTISGSGSDWHDVGSYFRPNAVGRYSFDKKNNIVFNKLDRLFDLAIMMDCSQCPVHPELRSVFFDSMKQHADTVRKYGTKPVFFMSWAYADMPEMTAQLADAYTKAANDSNAFVIPAGLAFAKSIEKKPGLNLYVADKRHPSLAGSYLAAATTYGALFQKSPVGLTYTAGLDQETAAFLQATAWQTLQQYFPQLATRQ